MRTSVRYARFLSLNRVSRAVLYKGMGGEECVWILRASWSREKCIHVGEMTQLGVLESKQGEEVNCVDNQAWVIRVITEHY